jgi:hypothetical protein
MLRHALAHIRSRRFSVAELSLMVALLGFVAAAPTLSTAATCSTVSSCKSGDKAATNAANKAVGAAITLFQTNVEYYVDTLLDRLVRASNNDSQSSQSKNTAALNSIDPENTGSLQQAVGATRGDLAQAFIPSASSCALVSRNIRLSNAQFAPARIAQYETSQRQATDYASNRPGGPTAKGSIQAAQNTFNDMLTGFCDSAVLAPPGGVSCTMVNDSAGRPMRWRYTEPFDAIFSRETIPLNATDPEHRAARLFSRMLVEPVPPDPLQGAALSRQEGQTAFLRRQSDIAAINLARGVIDRMTDDRLWDGNPSNPSLQQLRNQAWADANVAYQDALLRGRQGEETNIRDLPGLILDNNRIYLQIYLNLERLAAIKATSLARTIQGQNAGTGSQYVRFMGRQ